MLAAAAGWVRRNFHMAINLKRDLGIGVSRDPYPDPNAGPEVVGGRPREFQKPLPEPVRSRYLTDSWWQR